MYIPSSRHYVISQLPHLEYLDDTAVSTEEREKALKIYDRRRSTSTLNRGGGEGGKDTRNTNGVVSEDVWIVATRAQ